jgi:transposase
MGSSESSSSDRAPVNPTQKRYPSELKERAVRMVLDLRRADPADTGVVARVARQLGVGVESLRTWVKQAEIDAGQRPGLSTQEHDELVQLRKEVKELRRANEILQAAASFFGAELDRRQRR